MSIDPIPHNFWSYTKTSRSGRAEGFRMVFLLTFCLEEKMLTLTSLQDPDICYPHVDEGLDLSIPDAATQQQSAAFAITKCRGFSTLLQYHYDSHMDHAVSTDSRCMG